MALPQTAKTGPRKSPRLENQGAELTPEQHEELDDPDKQEQYRAAYLVQQARTLCPGCGDDGLIF